MDPTQPNVPTAGELRFLALEQAFADSLAMQENTQKQVDRLLNGFQHLKKLMQAAKILPPSPENRPADIIPVQPAVMNTLFLSHLSDFLLSPPFPYASLLPHGFLLLLPFCLVAFSIFSSDSLE